MRCSISRCACSTQGADTDIGVQRRCTFSARRLAKGADDLVKLFEGETGKSFAGSGTPQELAEALDVLRPIAQDAAQLILAQELERSLRRLASKGLAKRGLSWAAGTLLRWRSGPSLPRTRTQSSGCGRGRISCAPGTTRASRHIARKVAVDDDLFLIGRHAGEVVGVVMAGYDGHRGWINYLAVDPAHRAAGLGRALIAEAERRLRMIGCPKINLQVRGSNTEVLAFYEHLGFRVDDAVSMGKRLVHDDHGGDERP